MSFHGTIFEMLLLYAFLTPNVCFSEFKQLVCSLIWIFSSSSCLCPLALCSGLPFSILLGSVGPLFAAQDVGVPESCIQSAHICTPTHTHTRMCTILLRASKHCIQGWMLAAMAVMQDTVKHNVPFVAFTEKCNHTFKSLTELFALNCLTSTSPNKKIPPE